MLNVSILLILIYFFLSNLMSLFLLFLEFSHFFLSFVKTAFFILKNFIIYKLYCDIKKIYENILISNNIQSLKFTFHSLNVFLDLFFKFLIFLVFWNIFHSNCHFLIFSNFFINIIVFLATFTTKHISSKVTDIVK